MGNKARVGVICLMGLAICLARLVEVEFKQVPLPSASIAGAQTPGPESPAPDAIPDPGAQTPPVVPTPAAAPTRTYVVKSGDTLGRISKKVYGTTKHWNAIYEANRSLIPTPKRVPLGKTLTIPVVGR